MKTEQLKNEHCQECDFKGYKLDDTVGISFYAKMIQHSFLFRIFLSTNRATNSGVDLLLKIKQLVMFFARCCRDF